MRVIRAARWRLLKGPIGRFARDAGLLNPAVHGGGWDRVYLANDATVNDALFNVASGTITVEAGVCFGHRVMLLTGTHDHTKFGQARRRAIPPTGRDIRIEAGAWLASNVTIIGPCRVGRNAVVATGAVVTHDVDDDAIVAGIPARPVDTIVDGAMTT